MKCEKPCPDCPWLAENQTPEKVRRSPQGGKWFSRANLRRHWEAVCKHGALLPCHMTDPHAVFYGSSKKAIGEPRICVGVAILVKRECLAFMQHKQEHKTYRRLPGTRMTMLAMQRWATRLMFPGAYLNTEGRSLQIPAIDEDRRVKLPWRQIDE